LVPFLILVLIAVLLIPLQTSFEEYLFRGYWMQGLGILAKKPLGPIGINFGSLWCNAFG
jgi:membrane protease YdiL (CAAX protease family)